MFEDIDGIEFVQYNYSNNGIVVVINIETITQEVSDRLDMYIGKIWMKDNETDLRYIKTEIKNYICAGNEIKEGAVAEFFIHLYLNIAGYRQECLFQNLEENSYKKGFDGYYTNQNESWIVESKSTSKDNIRHHSKISEAYGDLIKKINSNNSNNPWKNAYNHAKMSNSSKKLLDEIKEYSKDFYSHKEHKIDEFNIIPCSTIFVRDNTTREKKEVTLVSVSDKINTFSYKNIIAICVNNSTIDNFIEYLERR